MTIIKEKPTIFDVQRIRDDFPILQEAMDGKPLVYLDNANTTQKPRSVIAVLNEYYHHHNANIHRSVYTLSERATQLYENARDKVQAFIHAPHRHEVIFVKGATEAINLVANSLGQCMIHSEDEILISTMEHHSNIVPWQLLCERTGATLKVIPINEAGELQLDAFAGLLTEKTKILAITHVSNVLGTINPIRELIQKAHEKGALVLVDGAQAAPHLPVNVQELDCDFYVFSSHKLYGPTGVGVLYGKSKWLEQMPPYQGGGNMISQVTFEKTSYAPLPYKFEAGTANIADVIGMGAAIDYVNEVGIAAISEYEQQLVDYACKQLAKVPGLRFIGTPQERAGVIAFVIEQVHAHDVGSVLNAQGVAVRVGHHCAMPLMARFDVPATVRVSFGIYNTFNEVDVLVAGLLEVVKMFQVTHLIPSEAKDPLDEPT